MKVTDVAEKTGESVITLVGNAQGLVVNAVGAVSELAAGVIPTLPKLPLAEALPTPHEVVDRTYGFAGRVLEQQKDYAAALIAAIEPLTAKFIANGKKKTARKSPAKA